MEEVFFYYLLLELFLELEAFHRQTYHSIYLNPFGKLIFDCFFMQLHCVDFMNISMNKVLIHID